MEGWGWTPIANPSDYQEASGDSDSLAKIDGKPFTITHIEDSNYTQGDESTPGVKITIKEEYGGFSKFHTTRVAIVSKLRGAALREDVNSGKEVLYAICKLDKAKNGKDMYVLADVPTEAKQEKL